MLSDNASLSLYVSTTVSASASSFNSLCTQNGAVGLKSDDTVSTVADGVFVAIHDNASLGVSEFYLTTAQGGSAVDVTIAGVDDSLKHFLFS